MSMMTRIGGLALGALLAWSVTRAAAQDGAWRPAPAPTPVAPASIPTASLGRPIAVADAEAPTLLPPLPPADAQVSTVSHAEPIPQVWPPDEIILTEASEPPPVPPPGTPPVPSYPLDPTLDVTHPLNGGAHGGGFWDNGNWAGKRCAFQSDHAFDEWMISPLSNPFFFEDPRSLTEVRPIFIYQHAPGSTPIFAGGHSDFFGLQGRVAITDRWSIVMNKLGWVSQHPNDPTDDIHSQTGFAEFDIGPKWTFLRNDCSRTLMAAGLTFEIPTGKAAEQNTGTLGLDPYVTFAQNFGRNWLPAGFGSFNFLAEGGYSFSVDDKRAQYLHASLHLDYDVVNLHRIYPLIELNWFHLTRRGDSRDLTFEGGDLINLGSSDVSKRDLLTLNLGARYKVREWLQFGGGVEFPLTSYKGIEDWRLTFDVIFRY